MNVYLDGTIFAIILPLLKFVVHLCCIVQGYINNRLHIEDVKIVDHSMACCTLG